MQERVEQNFEKVANAASDLLGKGVTCAFAIVLVTLGLMFLPIDQVNIAISVATLILLFLLQSSQNRSDKAMHLKLDELITHLKEPRDDTAGIEERPMKDLDDRKTEIDETIEDK